jgi:hypothetical protein
MIRIQASSPRHDRARNLLPRWHGWVAKSYGPGACYKIPRQAALAWHMESRAFWKAFRAPFWGAGYRRS